MSVVLLIDATNRIHINYHGWGKRSAPAVDWLSNQIDWFSNEYRPAWIAAAFDPPGHTWRHQIYSDYKAGRAPKEIELENALDSARIELPNRHGLWAVEKHGYEADDCLATIRDRALDQGHKVVIFSKDKDLRQLLIHGQVTLMRDLKSDRRVRSPEWYSADHLHREFGFPPDRWIDYQCLVGDSTDNIIGADGIGDVKAKTMLAKGSLGEILINPWKFIDKSQHDALRELERRLPIVRQLVTLRNDVPI